MSEGIETDIDLCYLREFEAFDYDKLCSIDRYTLQEMSFTQMSQKNWRPWAFTKEGESRLAKELAEWEKSEGFQGWPAGIMEAKVSEQERNVAKFLLLYHKTMMGHQEFNWDVYFRAPFVWEYEFRLAYIDLGEVSKLVHVGSTENGLDFRVLTEKGEFELCRHHFSSPIMDAYMVGSVGLLLRTEDGKQLVARCCDIRLVATLASFFEKGEKSIFIEKGEIPLLSEDDAWELFRSQHLPDYAALLPGERTMVRWVDVKGRPAKEPIWFKAQSILFSAYKVGVFHPGISAIEQSRSFIYHSEYVLHPDRV